VNAHSQAVRTRRARGRGRLPSARGNAGPVPSRSGSAHSCSRRCRPAASVGRGGGRPSRSTRPARLAVDFCGYFPSWWQGRRPGLQPLWTERPGPTGGERCTVPAAVADGRRAARDLPAGPAPRAERPAARRHTRRAPRARAGGLPRRRSPRQHGSAV